MDDLLQINDLTIRYETADGVVRAVNGASLRLGRGRNPRPRRRDRRWQDHHRARASCASIPVHRPATSAAARFSSRADDLLKASDAEMRGNIRGQEISMIFQDPMTALNPVMTVGDQIAEVIAARIRTCTKKQITQKRAMEMLETVGISARACRRLSRTSSPAA